MRPLGIKGISRTAAFVAIAAAIAATAFHLTHDGTNLADRAAATVALPKDPLARELARCRTIGIAAKDDTGCAAAWAESRRRFFAPLSEHLPTGKANDAKPKPEGK